MEKRPIKINLIKKRKNQSPKLVKYEKVIFGDFFSCGNFFGNKVTRAIIKLHYGNSHFELERNF